MVHAPAPPPASCPVATRKIRTHWVLSTAPHGDGGLRERGACELVQPGAIRTPPLRPTVTSLERRAPTNGTTTAQPDARCKPNRALAWRCECSVRRARACVSRARVEVFTCCLRRQGLPSPIPRARGLFRRCVRRIDFANRQPAATVSSGCQGPIIRLQRQLGDTCGRTRAKASLAACGACPRPPAPPPGTHAESFG